MKRHPFYGCLFVNDSLPILIAISAAKVFGGNQFLGAVIGMIMIHSDLINAWSVSGMDASQIPTAAAWFRLYDIKLVGYQGHVIPVVIAVWLMCMLEKKLHKIVPEIIDLFVTPLVTVLVTGYVTLTVIGPVFSTLENYVLAGAQHLIGIPFGIGSTICGALYAPTVVAGLHHMYNAIEIGLLSQTGVNSAQTDYGTVLIFGSDDLHHWNFEKDVTLKERFGYMWECPDYFYLNGQPVLSLSPQGLEAQKYQFQNIYQSGYFLPETSLISEMEISKTEITASNENNSTEDRIIDGNTFREWDHGFDFYAPQTFEDEKGRRILIGWAGIGDAPHDNEPTVEKGWQHALTLPRELVLQDGVILQQPLEELKQLRGQEQKVCGDVTLEQNVFELGTKAFDKSWSVAVSDGAEQFSLTYAEGILCLNISEKAGRGRGTRQIQIADVHSLRMIVDTSMVEIYVNDGEAVLTSRFYFEHDTRSVQMDGIAEANLWHLNGLEIIK